MFFVGRDQETNRIIRLIERNNNVIVTGKYGIGRTSLIRHVADITRDRWRFIFVDFSQTPARACRDMLSQLLSEKQFAYRRNKKYKSNRFLVANLNPEDKRQLVIALDNIAKLSNQKLAFLRTLAWEKKFRFVAIVENFLPEKDLDLLRRELIPAQMITLQHLNQSHSVKLIHYFVEKHHFSWDDKQIKQMALTVKGYPLGIRGCLSKELKRRDVREYERKKRE